MLQEWWDDGKEHYKAIAITHAVRKSRNSDTEIANLINKLSTLKQSTQPNIQRIQDIERQLKDLEMRKIDGVKIRSRATWLEEGEKPTKFFFNLEKKQQERACITKLLTENGHFTADEDILKEARSFYCRLYQREPVDTGKQDELLKQMGSRLSEQAKKACKEPLTTAEVTAAINWMNKNKSPGPDGLTTEFYLTFWDELESDLADLFNYNFMREEMSFTQRESTQRLLFKKDQKELLTNWRPISLLNSDYKLLATVMANRLRYTLPEVIDEDQTCGIPERTIFDSVLQLRDLTHEAISKNTNLILISLDQEKAFERVDRQFVFQIMKRLNYGPNFIRWLQTLHTGENCRIINNGWKSAPIDLERGVRQGCPLSPLLYTLVIETLANAIRANPQIIGIQVPRTRKQSKIIAYADDGTLTLKDDLSVIAAFEQIKIFEEASGSKLNLRKMEGTYVGLQAGRDQGPIPITWKTDSIRILGTNIGNKAAQDWEKPTQRVENTLKRWTERHLTVKGKAVILRTYALATVVYLASIFPIPESYITRIHCASFGFLWGNKNELVSRKTCHLPLGQGGLGIPDIHIIRRLSIIKWLQSIVNRKKTAVWLAYGWYWTGQALGCIRNEWQWLRSNLKPHGDTAPIRTRIRHQYGTQNLSPLPWSKKERWHRLTLTLCQRDLLGTCYQKTGDINLSAWLYGIDIFFHDHSSSGRRYGQLKVTISRKSSSGNSRIRFCQRRTTYGSGE